jgi:hypothetical protein
MARAAAGRARTLGRHRAEIPAGFEQLASHASPAGNARCTRRDEDGRIIGADGEGDGEDQEQDDTDGAAESLLPRFAPRDGATSAAFLRTRLYRPESPGLAGGLRGAPALA